MIPWDKPSECLEYVNFQLVWIKCQGICTKQSEIGFICLSWYLLLKVRPVANRVEAGTLLPVFIWIRNTITKITIDYVISICNYWLWYLIYLFVKHNIECSTILTIFCPNNALQWNLLMFKLGIEEILDSLIQNIRNKKPNVFEFQTHLGVFLYS